MKRKSLIIKGTTLTNFYRSYHFSKNCFVFDIYSCRKFTHCIYLIFIKVHTKRRQILHNKFVKTLNSFVLPERREQKELNNSKRKNNEWKYPYCKAIWLFTSP